MDFKLNWRISIKKSKLKAFKDLFSCLYYFQYIFTRKINKRKKVTNYANSKLSRNRMKQVNKSSLLKIGIFIFLNIVGIILTCCFTNHVTALWPRYVNSRLDFQVHQKHCTFWPLAASQERSYKSKSCCFPWDFVKILRNICCKRMHR